MARPQFTLRALLVLMLAVGCFFGGIRFERERRRRQDEAKMQTKLKAPGATGSVFVQPLLDGQSGPDVPDD